MTVRHDATVSRSRVLRLLNQRFDHRITTVVAEAGFGKSTALALAVDNNRLDPVGRDLWLSVTDDDTDPAHFIIGLATATGADAASGGSSGSESTLDRIVDTLWAAAPDDVALIIDDAHLLHGTPSVDVLKTLLSQLPTNVHLVVSSRRSVGLPLARLRAHGALIEITESDLALDDDELDELRALRPAGAPSAEGRATASDRATTDPALPRHAATADLRLAAGLEAGADFLWEEILAAYDPDRLTHLRRAAVLDVLDDELVVALTDGAFDISTLLAGTPLVDRHDDGSHRMHAILREALTARLEPDEERKTLAIAADLERQRLRLPRAVHLYHRSGDPIGAMETARQFALIPTMLQNIDAVRSTRRVVEQIDPDSPVCRILEAIDHFAGLDAEVAVNFLSAADAARSAGDDDLETLALYRAAQSQLLHHSDNYQSTHDRLGELADRNALARGVHAYLSSILAQLLGDIDGALALLPGFADLGRATELVARSERLYDLGRPEQVAVGLTVDDFANLPAGAEAFIGLSMWTRGDSTPGAAAVASKRGIERALRQGFTHTAVSTLGFGALIALAAGNDDVADRYARHATELAQAGVGASIAEVAVVACAAVAAVRAGDDEAAAIMAAGAANQYYPDAEKLWPSRAEIGSLALTYITCPDMRPMLDSADFGPSLRAAANPGRAIVAVRELDDVASAADLPWHRTNLLRANVLPTHLVELACAAIAADNSAARDLVAAIPNHRRHLQRAAIVSSSTVRAIAADLLGELPRPEPFTIRVDLLGPMRLLRNGQDLESRNLVARPKVRELLALLVERRRIERDEILDLLWPDHDDEDRARSSLRNTLSSLNTLLEPDRERATAAFHLHVGPETLGIDDRVVDDASIFGRLVETAQSDDRSGLPARALETYIEAVGHYRGDYVAGLDVQWAVLSRLRFRSLAVGSMCRIAELTSARGEPEDAARWAANARHLDPLSERAGRLFAAALHAAGDRSGARVALDDHIASLTAAGVDASPSTRRLADRIR